jgi:hypothetical protein
LLESGPVLLQAHRIERTPLARFEIDERLQ